VTIKTLCDTDELLFESRSKIVAEKTGIKPLTEWDIHKVLDNKEIDAVSIAVPNHWHALQPSGHVRQGNMYILKSRSHNIWEGRKMVDSGAEI